MSFETTGLEKIKTRLQSGPCLVAQLGVLLAESEKPQDKLGVALKRVGLEVGLKKNKTEAYAFLPEHKELFENIPELSDHSKTASNYKLALRCAFSKILPPNHAIYLHLYPRVRFEIVSSDTSQPEHSLLIDEEFRMPGRDLVDFSSNDGSDTASLFISKITAWSEKYEIDQALLIWTPPASPTPRGKRSDDIVRVFELFLEAQPEDIRSRVNIPCSLIELLLAKR